MAKAKRKTLPKDFEALLQQADLPAMQAVFDQCLPDARGGYSKQTALAYNDCPDELARWLVAQGADVEASDSYGETPLHSRARHWQGRIGGLIELGADVDARDSRGNTPLHYAAAVGNPVTARQLIEHGAGVTAVNGAGQTPLGYALAMCSNVKIKAVADIAELLLAQTPAPPPPAKPSLLGRLFGKTPSAEADAMAVMRAEVERIGREFEFHRASFSPELVDDTSTALDRLYVLFGVAPVPRRQQHDGVSTISVGPGDWPQQHQRLWQMLVPSQGAAALVQGEVIRLSGRIDDEINGNGGINWDSDHRRMGQALVSHLQSGTALPAADLTLAASIIGHGAKMGDAAHELCRLAVDWVRRNPQPVALPKPDYSR